MQKNKFLLVLAFTFVACKPTDTAPISLKDLAFIVSGGSKTVEVIDLKNQEVVNTYSITSESNRFPHHIYLSSDNSHLAIANPAYDFSFGHGGLHGKVFEGGIVVLDAATGKKIHGFDVPYANHNAVFSPNNSQIWTAGYSHSGRGYVFNKENAKLIKELQFDSDPSELFFTKDGQYAVVRSGESPFLQFMDVQSMELIRAVKVDLSTGNVWPGYEDLILVSNASGKSVNMVDAKLFRVVDFIDFEFSPGFLIYNERNDDLWVCDSTGNKIHIFKKNAGNWEEIDVMEFPEADPHMIKFYDNFSMALVINQKENTAVFIDAGLKEIKKTISVGLKPNGIALISN